MQVRQLLVGVLIGIPIGAGGLWLVQRPGEAVAPPPSLSNDEGPAPEKAGRTLREAVPPRPVVRSVPSSPSPPTPAPAAIPPEVLERAIDAEIARRSAQTLAVLERRETDGAFARLGTLVDSLVEDDVLPAEDAGDVEYVLQAEVEATWDIKRRVLSEDLSEAAGIAEWEATRAETDIALDALLGVDGREALRAALEQK
jgi:hypothetical protein